MSLISSIWKEDGENVTNSELDAAIKRVRKFFSLAIEGKLPGDRIDVGNPAYDVANTICEVRNELTTVRIIIVTNGETKPREGTNAKGQEETRAAGAEGKGNHEGGQEETR